VEDKILNFIYTSSEENMLYIAIVFSAFIGKIKEQSKQNLFFAWVSYFVGTVFHELAHLIVSILTNGKPTWISVFPSKRIENGKIYYTLGYINSSNITRYNVFFISMAPLMLLPFSYYVYTDFFIYFEKTLTNFFIYLFLIISLVFSSIPSNVDFKAVFSKGIFAFVFPIVLFTLSFYIYIRYEKLFGVFHV